MKILYTTEAPSKCRKEGQFVHSQTIPEAIAEYTKSLALFSKSARGARSTGNSKQLRLR
jgi:hypothetical protein